MSENFRNSRYMEDERRSFHRPPPPERKSTVGMSESDRLVEEVRYGLELGLYNSRQENQRFFGLMLAEHEAVEVEGLKTHLLEHEARMKAWIEEVMKVAFPDGPVKHGLAHQTMIDDAKNWNDRKKIVIDRVLMILAGGAATVGVNFLLKLAGAH